MTEKEFTPYEPSLDLKELGFDETCFGYYLASTLFISNDIVYNSTNIPVIKAPLYQQAFRWFREKYNRLHTVNIDLSNNLKDKVFVYTIEDYLGSIVDRSEEFKTYEEAELACLKKLIEIVKNK